MDQPVGEGTQSQPNGQATNIPRLVSDDIKNAARKALMQVPEGSTLALGFTDIRQGPNESYMQFINCLRQALDRQITQERAKDELLKRLAVSNANPECKKVLCALPQPEPMLTQMMEACNHLRTPEHSAASQEQVIGQGVTQALATRWVILQGHQQQGLGTCYGCSQNGHFAKDCLQQGEKLAPRTCGCKRDFPYTK